SVPSSLERGFSSPINSLSAKPVDLPKIRRRAHGGILGSSAQQGCSAKPPALECPQGVLSACGRIAPLYLRAGFRRMLRRTANSARTNKSLLEIRLGSVVDLKFLPLQLQARLGTSNPKPH